MSADRLIITPEQAETVLPEGEYIHNFKNPVGMFVGCDYERDDAIAALRNAEQIEIGGYQCKAMKHGLVVWKTDSDYSFFATDADSLEKLEAALMEAQ
jgi:hypothetical protein